VSFYEKTNRYVQFFALALATSSIASLIGRADSLLSGIAIALATTLGIFAQTMGLSEKQYTHKNLVDRYGDIRRELAALLARDRYNENDLMRLTSQFEFIRSTSTDTLGLLTDICFNEMIHEMNLDPSECVPISKVQRLTANLGDFGYSPPPGRRHTLPQTPTSVH
jgi:hypothetical protein